MKEEKMSVREYLLFVVRKKILSIVMVIVIFLLGFFGLKIYSDSRAYYQGSFMLYWEASMRTPISTEAVSITRT